MTARSEAIVQRITDYLTSGGLWNPEMANHDAVRELLMDCRAALAATEDEHRITFSADEVDEVRRLTGEGWNNDLRRRVCEVVWRGAALGDEP